MSITNPTEGRQYLAQAIRDSQRVDTIGDTVSFIVKVISPPVPMSSADVALAFPSEEGPVPSGSRELQDRLQFQGRIERGYFMSPHIAIPDPCDIYAASDTKIAAYQSLHLTCITPKGFNEPLKIGDRVRVTCRKGDFKMDLQFANVDSLETSFITEDSFFEEQECSELAKLFGDGEGSLLSDMTTSGGRNLGHYLPSNRKPGDVKIVVLHNTDSPASNQTTHPDYKEYALGNGSAKKLVDKFRRRDNVSIHWFVDGKGELVSMVPEKDIAVHANHRNNDSIGIEMVGYHAGLWSKCFMPEARDKNSSSYDPDTERFCPPGKIPDKRDPNRGVTDGYGHMYNKNMIETVSQLVADILLRWGLEANKETIRTHEEILPIQKTDPGVGWGNFDLEDFIERVKEKKKRNINNTQIIQAPTYG